jgi:uncharacterized protein (DUF4213/DUF364 family)
MKLFNLNIKTYEVEFSEEALLLEPFSVLFKRDKSEHKDIAIKELAYVYFFVDLRSDYIAILDEDVRSEEIIKDLKLPKSWKPDKKVENAIAFYKEKSGTVAARLLEDSYMAVDKVSKYLRDVNLEETMVIKGHVKPKHDVKKIADTIKLVPSLLSSLKQAETIYLKEKEESKQKSGSRDFNTFERGL